MQYALGKRPFRHIAQIFSKHKKMSINLQSFFSPFVLLGPMFRLRIEDKTKLSRIFNIFVVTRGCRVAIVTHEMAVVHRSANLKTVQYSMYYSVKNML